MARDAARWVAALAAGACALGVATTASAFCRTMTCPLPPDFQPSPAQCIPDDFPQFCASLSPPVSNPVPVWWRNACVGYDLQKDASRQISYDDAAQFIATAFTKWTGTTCPTDGTGPSRVSIDVRDLGPVDCNVVQYNSDQGNQNAIIFRDDFWPHNDANNTLALTTVTFDPDTGEIYDADMEINTAQQKMTLTDPVPADGYDFSSIVTHETGHFLGMAHSGDDHATMFAHYTPGTTAMRSLTQDDVGGICTIYPPNGTRSVDPSITSSGAVAEDACDPTPRHGFSTECGTSKKSCAVAAPGSGGGTPGAALAAGGAAFVVFARRRARPTKARWN
jgi:Matrixin